MDPNYSLIKLATELTDRVDALERENAALKVQVKQASNVAPAVTAKFSPVVSAEIADATCAALKKAGALSDDQVTQVKYAFMRDPEAAHRTIQGLIDAMANTKTASETKSIDLNGGSLVAGQMRTNTAGEACLDKMERILGMKL